MTTVLIVDEAHLVSDDLLEEVRLLSNLETFDDKLLQIVLVGQPELDAKLDSHGLRQLKQRIALRTQLGPLDFDETQRYIEQRLQIAGPDSDPSQIFPPDATAEVFRFSRGFPRLINTICENSLITAYAQQMEFVTPQMVRDVAHEFRFDLEVEADDEGDYRDSLRINGQFLDRDNASAGSFKSELKQTRK
jgi:general secretion pathway protein A